MNMLVTGNKGGGKSGSSSSSTPTEDPNNLVSKSTARIIDAISEGPIVGLVNDWQSVFLDDTPVQNSDGSFNFQGITKDFRSGLPTQSYIAGFSAAENEVSVGVQVKVNLPVTRELTDEDADAVLIKVKVAALTTVDTKTGDMHGGTVQLAIDLKTGNGTFVQVSTITISGKTTSEYERAQRVELPEGGAPWSFRVRRLTADSTSSYISNDTYVTTYTVIYDAKLSYPDTALIAYKIDAAAFGSSSPTRVVLVKGLITDVPSNYDPIARTYTGMWNGSFKKAWHNNPAWVLWDLCTNNRYGVGDILKASSLDKFGLYQIAAYCDGLVPDGFGGMEPRFTFNGVINTKEDAAKVLDAISSAFRGMIYWGTGSVMFTQDAPGSTVKLVAPANVIGGEFNYSGSALKTRHTSVLVTWNDPDDLGRSTVEAVQNDALIQKFGFRETSITAYGATSRGQARRAGEWLLDTEANETEVVTYAASFDHADVRPGQLIAVADPSYAGARFGGRLVAATLATLTLDKGIDIIAGDTYSISVVLPDGTISTNSIINGAGNGLTVINISPSLTTLPVSAAMWIVSATEAQPRLFRVISNNEKADNNYEITALFHDPNKYARIERKINLVAPNYSLTPTGALAPPIGLTIKEFFKGTGSAASPALTTSWKAPEDARVNQYELQIWGPNDTTWRSSIQTAGISYDDYPTAQGVYQFRVRSTALFVKSSAWAYFKGTIFGPNQPIGDVTGFSIASVGPTSILTWDMLATNVNILDHYEIRLNRSSVAVTWQNSDVLVAGIAANATSVSVPSKVGTYLIKAVSYAGVYSTNADVITSEIAGLQNINIVATLQESTAFTGTKVNTQVIASTLRLANINNLMNSWTTLAGVNPIGGGYVSDGYYYFANSLDLGNISQANVDANYMYGAVSSTNVMALWATLAAIDPIAQVTSDIGVTIEYRTSNDNVTFTAWTKLQFGNQVFRAIQFRAHLTSDNANVTPSVTSLFATVDMEDRTDNAYNVACPSGGVTVVFAPAFMAPPSIAVDGQGLATGDYHQITARSATGFTLQFFNSAGTGKAVTFDWIAKGYGYQQ